MIFLIHFYDIFNSLNRIKKAKKAVKSYAATLISLLKSICLIEIFSWHHGRRKGDRGPKPLDFEI